MIELSVEYHSGIPVYKQIITAFVTAIDLGELATGDKLPSIRELSKSLNINPNTTAKVYRELELTGMIESKAGSGSFVLPQIEKVLSAGEKSDHLKKMVKYLMQEAKKIQLTEKDVLDYIQDRVRQ